MKRAWLAAALLAAAGAAVWLRLREPTTPSNPSLGAIPPTAQPIAAAPAAATSLTALVEDGLRQTSPVERDHASRILLPRLVRLDPAAAVQLALARERGPARDDLLGIVVREWAATDLAAALAWLVSLSDPADRSRAATATLEMLAPDDPAGAIELGRWLGEGTGDGRLERTVQLWAEQHPDEAAAWTLAQPSGSWRDRLLARVVHVRAQQDPPAAIALATTGLPAGATRDEALVNVARHWAVSDPVAATAWMESLPTGLLQDRTRAEIERAAPRR